MRMRVLAGVLCLAGAAAAQQNVVRPAPDPATLGTVMGHVSLPESNLPARFASVMLQPVDMKSQVRAGTSDDAKMPVTVVQTGLDGSYRLDRVSPGVYYVVATLPGYLSPIAQFTPEQLAHPTAGQQAKIAATVPTVNVSANNATSADVRLTRGASIGGVVRFDDGSPDPAAKLALLKRNPAGRWEAVQEPKRLTVENDGRFHIDGLAAADYTLRLTLEVEERKQSAALGWVGMSSSSTKFTLDIYSGDTTIYRNAKTLTLAEGQALTGQDITVPVSKMHAVSGAVVDERTGQPLNAGRVTLVDSDGQGVVSASVDAETRTFTFSFAPEGEYTLTTSDAREDEPAAASDSTSHGQRPKPKALRTYASATVPVVVHGDLTGITLPVEEKAPSGAAQ